MFRIKYSYNWGYLLLKYGRKERFYYYLHKIVFYILKVSACYFPIQSFSVFADKVPIAVKDEKMRHILTDVYVKDISFWDARVLNLHYHCQGLWLDAQTSLWFLWTSGCLAYTLDKCKTIQPNCPFPGYIDKFCKCQTPEGTSPLPLRLSVSSHFLQPCINFF